MSEKPFSRTWLTLACCSGYFVLGLVISLIGVSLERLAGHVSASVTAVGGTFFIYVGIASIISLFATGPVIDRYGKKPVAVTGSLLTGASLLLICFTTSFGRACAAMFLMGLGTGCLNAGINTLINDLYPKNPGRALNLGNAFFGLGAVFLPLLAGWLFLTMGLKHLLILTAVFTSIPSVLFYFSVFPPPVVGQRFRFSEALRVFRDPLVGLIGLLLFFYVGLEASFGIWSRAAIADHWQLRPPFDQLTLAGFWTGLVLGRIFAATIFRTIDDEDLVLYCAVGSCAGVALFVLAPSALSASAGLWFAGLCFGPIFPSCLAITGQNCRSYPATSLTVVIACGVLGMVVITPAIGWVAEASSLMKGLWLSLGAGLMMLTVQVVLRKKVKKRSISNR
ncbi:MAG: MFS transporter [Gemmatimonadota bacterium]|nr:MFS transporter [Gemmatimonadota bacterium]